MRIWAQGIMVGLILLAGCQSPSTPATTTTGSGAYTVTFDSQGGSTVASISATSGAVIAAPTAPTKTGVTFGGWYKEAACTTAWVFASDVVTANLTLYAKWTLVGATVSTLAGGTAGLLDGIGTAAQFNFPTDATIDSSGNVYVIDNKYLIRKVTPAGVTSVFAGSVTTIFGITAAVRGTVDGPGDSARFFRLEGITIDASDNLFVVDRDDYASGYPTSRLRRVTSSGVVSTVTLTGLAAGTSLGDLSADGLGNLYATAYLFSATTMTGTYSIVKIGADGTVTTVATTSGTSSGLGVDKSTNTVLYLSGNNIYRLSASGTSTLYTTFTGASYTPYGRIAVNASGEAFIHAGEALYKVSAGTITLYSGGTYSGGRDGPVASASYFNPHLGSFGPSGQLCLVESGGNRVRMITP